MKYAVIAISGTQYQIEENQKIVVDSLNLKEEESYKNFFDTKKKFTEINEKLQEKLKEISKLNEKSKEYNKEEKYEKDTFTKRTLKEKADLVNEKIKQKKKLTTEDLLVLQSFDNN